MNAYIKFGEIMSICSQDIYLPVHIERKRNFGVNQGPQLCYKFGKMTCNNSKLDLANINAYIKFSEHVSICSHDIERKRNFGANQGSLLCFKCKENDV